MTRTAQYWPAAWPSRSATPTADDDPLIWVSPSFEQLTGYTSAETLGRNCRFLQGPDTDPAAVSHVHDAIAAQRTVSATVLNYRHDGSAFYNHLVVSPVFDADGNLTHRVGVQTDVTQHVLAIRERDAARSQAEQARRAQTTAEDAEHFSQLLLSMSEALTDTSTVEEVSAAITGILAAQLGASGGGLLLPNRAHTHLDFIAMGAMPPGTDAAWSRIAYDEDAPAAATARTHQAIYYPDNDALLAAHPTITAHAGLPAMGATANLPLIAGGDLVGVVFLYWNDPHQVPEQQQAALRALARYTAQAVQRATLLAERRTTAQVLQQSLLTRLPEPDHLELRARYVPAATGEHVGGDWYDAITLPGGDTTVVIGDVTGHDITAAAHMGQLRGLLRAYAFDRDEPPSKLVTRLERALAGLHVGALATLVVARIEQSEQDADQGIRRLHWTNAGHPPPILLLADGDTHVLGTVPEMLIGIRPEASRSDHTQVLPPGSTLLLYTDGLIEHRGRSLDDGITELRHLLSANATRPLDELLDHTVAVLIGDAPQDDCAILAIRAHPEDDPRPPEAGPNRPGT